jgi:RsiG-like
LSGDPAAMSVDELRRRRAELQTMDDAVSYVRRVAHGRADLARDAIGRSSDDGDPTPVYARRDLHGELRDVLSDRLLGDQARPPRPAEDFSEHPLAVELDELCAANGFSRLDRLTTSELETLVAILDAFEQRVSAQRKVVYDELDVLTDELVVRYRAEQAGED